MDIEYYFCYMELSDQQNRVSYNTYKNLSEILYLRGFKLFSDGVGIKKGYNLKRGKFKLF